MVVFVPPEPSTKPGTINKCEMGFERVLLAKPKLSPKLLRTKVIWSIRVSRPLTLRFLEN